jgi:hypothetical protein
MEEVRALISLVHEFLGLTPAIILIIFFWDVNIFLLLHELPQKIIPYFIIDTDIISKCYGF